MLSVVLDFSIGFSANKTSHDYGQYEKKGLEKCSNFTVYSCMKITPLFTVRSTISNSKKAFNEVSNALMKSQIGKTEIGKKRRHKLIRTNTI